MADKKKNKISIKNVVACGIGTALFVVLTEVQIPIGIPNTSLQPRMAVLCIPVRDLRTGDRRRYRPAGTCTG